MRMWAAVAAIAALVGASAGAGGAAAPPPSSIKLFLPRAGHVTLVVAKIELRGRAAVHAPKKFTFRYVRGASRGAVVLSAVSSARTATAATYRMLFVILNPVRTARSLAARRGEPPPGFLLFNYDPNAKASNSTVALDWLLFADVVTGGKAIETFLGSGSSKVVALQLPNVDTLVEQPKLPPNEVFGVPARRETLEFAQYDDAHPRGWHAHTGSEPWVQQTLALATAPAAARSEIVDSLYQDAGLQAPSAARCTAARSGCNYRFSFTGPLHMDWQWPVNPYNKGRRDTSAFDVLSGTGCGPDPTHAVWTIVEQTEGLPQQQLQVDLVHGTTTNPAKITDAQYAGGEADVQIYLQFTGGGSPQVTLLAQPHGDVVGPTINPATAAISVAPAKTC